MGFKSPAAHAGVMANGDLAAPKAVACGFESRLPYSVPGRLTGRTRRSERWNRGSNPCRGACRRARLRPRFRTAGGPGRHRAAAPSARSPNGRGARPRAWMLPVRIRPGAPRRHARPRPCPCTARDPGRHRMTAGDGSWGNGIPPGFGPGDPGPIPGEPAQAFVAVAARARPWYGRGRGFESHRRLHADVAQQAERHHATVEVPGSRPGIRSYVQVAQLAGGTAPRPPDVWVRVPPWTRKAARAVMGPVANRRQAKADTGSIPVPSAMERQADR